MKTKAARTLSAHVSDEIVDMIVRRAKANNVSKSKYTSMILEQWAAQKYPAVSTVDGTARTLVKQQMDDAKSCAANPQKGKSTRSLAKIEAASQLAMQAEFEASNPKRSRRGISA